MLELVSLSHASAVNEGRGLARDRGSEEVGLVALQVRLKIYFIYYMVTWILSSSPLAAHITMIVGT